MIRSAGLALAACLMTACASAPPEAQAQTPPMDSHMMDPHMMQMHMMPPASTIQPETTITLVGRGSVDHAPDIAMISLGVQVEAPTAAAAMSQQAEKMNQVFSAVKAAGIADRDMQTSNLSLNPVYEYPKNAKPVIRGYQASNQLGVRVRKLDSLGKTLDAVVKAGGNTIQGVSFSIDKPEPLQDEARIEAIKNAAAKADLYAKAVGYRVKRIVTVSENEYAEPPRPVMMARMQQEVADAAPTPVAAGEVSLTATVNVTFELVK